MFWHLGLRWRNGDQEGVGKVLRLHAGVLDTLRIDDNRSVLDQSCVVVVRYQGPSANGMPELHKLTPILGILQDRGHEVALVTDGRMSGASGKVPAAIHLTPEAALDGPISKLNTGDIIELDAYSGTLNVELPEAELTQRPPTKGPDSNGSVGRSFFDAARRGVGTAEQGASFLFPTKGDR